MSRTVVQSAPTPQGVAAPPSEVVTGGPRVGLFGLFGIGNFGNDGSLEAMIAIVRRNCPDARLVCFCTGPERVRERLGVYAVAMKAVYGGASQPLRRLCSVLLAVPNFFNALARLWRLDVLIVPGTGILDDYCSGPLGIPLDVFTWCLAARVTRTPVWFVSIGAGPITNPLSRRLMVWAAKLAQFRSYRDTNSKLFLAAAGVDTQRDLVIPDIAFDLARPEAVPARPDGDPLTVGVGVMAYWGWRDSSESSAIHGTYQDSLSRFCAWLLESGYRVRLLAGDDADERAIRSLRSLIEVRLSEPTLIRNVLVAPAHTLADVMAQIAGTDVVVATRYHNVVCALKMGKPTLSLSYAEKNAALLEDAGLGAFVDHVESFDIEHLKERFQELVSERATLVQSVAAFGALTKKRLQHQEELLRAGLLGTTPETPLGRGTQAAGTGARLSAAVASASCRTPVRAQKGL
jgi:polysaccharide pyruvyl transferase WcaK-like protein